MSVRCVQLRCVQLARVEHLRAHSHQGQPCGPWSQRDVWSCASQDAVAYHDCAEGGARHNRRRWPQVLRDHDVLGITLKGCLQLLLRSSLHHLLCCCTACAAERSQKDHPHVHGSHRACGPSHLNMEWLVEMFDVYSSAVLYPTTVCDGKHFVSDACWPAMSSTTVSIGQFAGSHLLRYHHVSSNILLAGVLLVLGASRSR